MKIGLRPRNVDFCFFWKFFDLGWLFQFIFVHRRQFALYIIYWKMLKHFFPSGQSHPKEFCPGWLWPLNTKHHKLPKLRVIFVRGDFGHLKGCAGFGQIVKIPLYLAECKFLVHSWWESTTICSYTAKIEYLVQLYENGQNHPKPGWLWPPHFIVAARCPIRKIGLSPFSFH